MNAYILSNPQTWQPCNEKKVIDQAKKKVEAQWDWFQIAVQCLEEVRHPLLENIDSKKLLHIIGIFMWEVEFIPGNTFSWIEKDDDLVETIRMTKVSYEKPFKLAWDAYNWNFESTKAKREKEMQDVCKYHESKTIRG